MKKGHGITLFYLISSRLASGIAPGESPAATAA